MSGQRRTPNGKWKSLSRPQDERFWEKVDRTGDCWIWSGATNGGRYGSFAIRDENDRATSMPAHRFAYEITYGEIPDGRELHHICGVKLCVRPSHLAALTRLEHVRAEREARAV